MQNKSVSGTGIAENNQIILEGIISIQAAINAGKRKILNIFVDKNKQEKRDRKTIHFLKFPGEIPQQKQKIPEEQEKSLLKKFL